MNADPPQSTFVITGLTAGVPIRRVADRLRIGRSPDCELRLEHPSVSDFHAIIGIGEEGRTFFILNVSPSDGMTVNGRDVPYGEVAFAANGDVLGIGPFLLSLRHDGHALHIRVSREVAPPAGEAAGRGAGVATGESRCPACGSPVTNVSAFCLRCGWALTDVKSAPPRGEAPTETTGGDLAAGGRPPAPQYTSAPARAAPPPQPAEAPRYTTPMPSPGTTRGGSPRGGEPDARPARPPLSLVESIGKRLHALARRATRRAADCDPVDCTVFSPSAVERGATFMVQVFAHRPEQTRAAQELAAEFDGAAARRGFTSLEAEVRRGAKLTLHLALPDFRVAGPVQSLTWRGRPESVQFEVSAPAETGRETFIGTVTVSEDGVPLGHVKFKISVAGRVEARRAKTTAGASARRYRKAFISYAAQDRAEVLKRVQMLAGLKIKFFQDVIDLEPGARWERQLYRHIDECDLFLLFWSSAAKQSEWVLNEVRYALARKRDDDTSPPEIIPVIIEGPPPVAPPPELSHLHFNDYLVYFMAPPGA